MADNALYINKGNFVPAPASTALALTVDSTSTIKTITSAAALDTVMVAGRVLPYCSQGVDASGGASHITATGVKVGDLVLAVFDVTNHTMRGSAVFETTVSVNDQIQQLTVNLSAATLVILVVKQS